MTQTKSQVNRISVFIMLLICIIIITGIWFGFTKHNSINATPQNTAKTLVKALLTGDVDTVVKLNYSQVHEQELKWQFAQKFSKSKFSDFTFTEIEDRIEVKNNGKEIDFYYCNMNGKYFITSYSWY
jgi:hypothetical protein